MRIRHRVPSIFSLSMVDVLCCALGCVILLWLLNAKQQEDEAEELVEKARAERVESESRIVGLTDERDRTRANLDELKGRVVVIDRDRSERESELARQRALAARLQADLEGSRRQVVVLTDRVRQGNADLDRERKESKGLGKQLSDTEARVRGVQLDLDQTRAAGAKLEERARGLEVEVDARQKELAALGKRLEEMGATRRVLERTLDTQEKALSLAMPYKDRWAAAEDRARAADADLRSRAAALDEARAAVSALQGDKRTLEAAVGAARAAADNRFAGIELTGRRVLFLVDISGSMEMVDEKTLAPEKWVEVCNTVARLMRSLGALEKYQVIAFSNDVNYPLGGDGAWLDFDPRRSPDQVFRAMRAIKPKGGTNMYDAFKAAFRYRAAGLDTIYFLSDGLPNLGEGMPAERAGLTEMDRGALLGRHIRQTLRADWNAPQRDRARVRINTIGFFFESPDLGAFLWALAREHEGSFVGMSKP